MQFILASQSPYRKLMLENFGLQFQAHAPKVIEENLKKDGPKELIDLTRFLALKKAESLKSLYSNAIIIGSDQIAEIHGQRLDKPGSADNARSQLKILSGKTHRLITSIAVISPLKTVMATDLTTITMRTLSDEEIAAYVALDQPLDCAGAYKIEKAGLTLMEKVDSQDPSAIQGLPLIALTRSLNELGIHITQMWSHKK